jgi:tRNA A-37 threonylcarbamoyl transferase component Bud32
MEIENKHQDLMSSSAVKYSLNRDNSTKPSALPMSDNLTPSVSLNLSSNRQMSPDARIPMVDSSCKKFYGNGQKPSSPYQVQKQTLSSIDFPSKGLYHDGIQMGPVLKESVSTSAIRKSMIELENQDSLPSINFKHIGSNRVLQGVGAAHKPNHLNGFHISSSQMAAYLAGCQKSPMHHVYNNARIDFCTKSSLKTLEESKDMQINILELNNQREYLASKVKNLNQELYTTKGIMPSSASSKEGSANEIGKFSLMNQRARDSVAHGSIESSDEPLQNHAHKLFKNKNLADAAIYLNTRVGQNNHPLSQAVSPSKLGTANKMVRVQDYSKKEKEEFNSPGAPSQTGLSKTKKAVQDPVLSDSGTDSHVLSLSRQHNKNISGAVIMRGGSQGTRDHSHDVQRTESSKHSHMFASRGIADSTKKRLPMGSKGFSIKPIAQVTVNRSESVGITKPASNPKDANDQQVTNLANKKTSLFSFGPSGKEKPPTKYQGQTSNMNLELRVSKSSGNMLPNMMKKMQPSQPINMRRSIRLEWGPNQSAEKLDLLQEFQLDKMLGKGNSSIVHKAYDLKLKKTVAVKIIDKSNVKESYLRDMLQKEIDISVTLEHPSLAQLYRVLQDTSRVYIVQEFCGTTSLSQYTSNRKLNEKKVRTIFQQIVQGVSYMHGKGFSHRDLKFSNILINDVGLIKIVDFGFACENLKRQRIFCGTPSYMSPELVKKKEYYAEYVDLWALGVILYKLITNEYPFGACNDKDLERRIEQMKFTSVWVGRSQPKGLIDELLKFTPHERLSAQDTLNHAWMLEN